MTTISRARPKVRAPESGERAVVIGAGFGGIAAALRLRARGYRVRLIDRMPMLGGRAQAYERDGFRYDAGPTVITAPFLLEELFALFGRRMEDYVDLRPVLPWYRFYFHDGERFDYGGSLDDTVSAIERISQPDGEGYRKLLAESKRIFDKGFTELGDQPFHRLRDILRVFPAMMRLKSYRSVSSFVRSHIRDERLRQAFSIAPLLVGGNPFDTTSIYALIHYLEREWGVHFPMGGTGALVAALGRLCEEVGIEIELGTTVDRLDVRNDTVRGVFLEDGRHEPADVVVSNADAPYLYRHMVDPWKRPKWTNRRIDRMRYSMGLFVLYFGTTRRYEDVPHHSIVLGPRFKGLLHDIFHKRRLAEDFSLYLHRPTATDPSMAPEGCDSWYVLSPVPNLRGDVDWSVEGPRYRDRIVEHLDERLLPGLRETITADFFVTPNDFRSRFLSHHGSGFSIQPLFRQSAYFRFHNKSEDVRNLFLVGAGTHPGAGLPGVLTSAKVLERVLPARSPA
ncbi:MAG: phytoene desaturase family protein [Planctomycetota bacterium]